MNDLTNNKTGNNQVTTGRVTTRPTHSARYSWYLSFFDGHAQLCIGPCGYDCKEWRELGPVDEKELRRDSASAWQQAILKYKVNAYDYRCKVASVPFTGDLPHWYLVQQLKRKGIL